MFCTRCVAHQHIEPAAYGAASLLMAVECLKQHADILVLYGLVLSCLTGLVQGAGQVYLTSFQVHNAA